MSDFIGRVAARAVGARPAAAPHVPSRFEADRAAGASLLEVIAEEAANGGGPPTRDTATGSGKRAEPPMRSAAPHHAPPDDRTPQTDLDSSRAPGPPHLSPRPLPPSPEATERRSRAPEPEQPRIPGRARPQTRASRAAVTVAARPLPPAPPVAAREHSPVAHPPAAARAEDQPVVRVHIGRLEVRANLQQEPQRPERRPAPRPPELSLSDYLRGQRVSR